ncbi:MAG: RNA 2',3'-cyclic phosphodiesterase [Desulfobacterales bacterium]|nr:MAG: RNA 2',3'-cyclic phosphodiesterase [Desulfobacterales bacterium]
MSETIRAFIAFEIPDDVLSSLSRVQEGLKSYKFQAKWVRPQSIHLTLKFLGTIQSTHIRQIARVMHDAAEGYAPITLSVRGIGVFPNIRRPRVIWVGLAGQVNLLGELQQKLDVGLSEIGFQKEERSFKGHLTLGRFKTRINSADIIRALEEFAEFETQPFAGDQLILFKSELRPTGAVYSKLEHVSL